MALATLRQPLFDRTLPRYATSKVFVKNRIFRTRSSGRSGTLPSSKTVNQQAVTLAKAVRYSRNLALKVEATQRVVDDRGFLDPLDAVIEGSWEDAGQLMEHYDTPEAQVLRKKIADYESQFIDKSRSTAFFTEFNLAE